MNRLSFEVSDTLGQEIRIQAIKENLTLRELAQRVFCEYLELVRRDKMHQGKDA